ncbi:PaaI family thioesterase [Spongiibacter marinus]|uniref:PaaI family thioesterase n=1 Tax=Spongiibacter marinus TaxID=354246 RepID=UPI0035BE5809
MTGFNELVGLRLCGGDAERYFIELDVKACHCHDAGFVHGGVYLSLLDTVMSRAVRALDGEASVSPTMNLNCSFFRPQSSGLIRAEGRVINRSKNITFAEGALYSPEGKLLAKGTANFSRVRSNYIEGAKPLE